MLFEKNINGQKFVFFCEYWENKNYWGHKCVLHVNGNELGSNKVRYYNRTWESYKFQACMKNCVCNLIENCKKIAFDAYKNGSGKKRLSSRLKDQIIKDNKEIQLYIELLNSL